MGDRDANRNEPICSTCIHAGRISTVVPIILAVVFCLLQAARAESNQSDAAAQQRRDSVVALPVSGEVETCRSREAISPQCSVWFGGCKHAPILHIAINEIASDISSNVSGVAAQEQDNVAGRIALVPFYLFFWNDNFSPDGNVRPPKRRIGSVGRNDRNQIAIRS